MSQSLWQELSGRLRTSQPYGRLLADQGDVCGLPLPAAAWVGGLLAEDAGRPLLAVVRREADALRWVEAAQLIHGMDAAVHFPSPSLTPYHETEISLPVRAQESLAVDRAVSQSVKAVVCTPRALFRRLPMPEEFTDAVLVIRPQQELPLETLTHHLLAQGYCRSDLVSSVGEFAVRGGVVDVFPPGEPAPVRLDLFGDTVESIRAFEPVSQRSAESLSQVRLLPLTLFRLGKGQVQRVGAALASRAGADLGPEALEQLSRLEEGHDFPGWENYLPLLAPETCGLTDLLRDPLVAAVDPEGLAIEVERHAERLQRDYESRQDHRRLAVATDLLEHSPESVQQLLDGAEVRLRDLALDGQRGVDFRGGLTDLFHGQLPRFPREVETARDRGDRLLLVCTSEHRHRLETLLESHNVPVLDGGVELISGELERGFRLPAAGVVVVSESQLFARRAPEKRSSRQRLGSMLSGLRDLKVGDFVVHADHGIGQFVGLRSVGETESDEILPPELEALAESAGGETEVMELLYTAGKRLLVPLSRMDLVQKYSGIEGMQPRLDQLGGTSWNRTKNRVKREMREMAGELLKLYAERELSTAPVMPAGSMLQQQFESGFEYDETPDQLEAAAAIREDLGRPQPMDRLLCGDVGFGKTEVGMRAAFQAVESGYQVALLAPTTILADQHLATFRRRFAEFPVEIDMISRFRSAAEVKDVRRRLKEGRVDILIGTHRLLSRDIEIPKLGLLIVDEEQRFGVAQKERLKQLKKNVHVLAMTATPVPRTLQLSLAGVRDLSLIETPPRDRMAVETSILPFTPELVREAIELEMERGGQVYYVYNRVESIDRILAYLKELVPSVRITVGHGQLEEKELARRMHAFTRGDHDLLLATTIIENGIDIPRVNTMIVHRAERFGLAQLYQLRGRVGRSNQLAYCYLLVPPDRVLSEPARKRLAAIREFSDLGAGFRIAARDLEIRGAGNLLGAEQSGQIAVVGIETYLKLLEETVRELKGEAVPEVPSTAIDLPVPMAIPHSYIGDANLRMEIYRKLASASDPEQELLEELRDRFGPPPDVVRTFLKVVRLKQMAETLRVQTISAKRGRLTIRMRRDARVDVDSLIRLVSEHPDSSFSPSGVLSLSAKTGPGALETAIEVLRTIAGDPALVLG